ncbi:MAG: acyltransferase [Acidobacteriaceae bacterium]
MKATSIPFENAARAGAPRRQREKLASVQGLRAAAALLVVWTHSIDAAEAYSSTRQASFFHLAGFGACGLDIFFVISGFIVSLVAARAVEKGEQSAGQFLSRRFTRIYPLYWILTLVVILEAELGRHPVAWHSVSWLPTALLLPSLTYPVASPILSLGWSLVFEMYFYFVLAASMALMPRHLVRNTIVFLAGMVALGALVGFRRPLLILWSNPILLEFLFGCAAGLMYSRQFGTGARAASRLNISATGRWLTALGAGAMMTTLFTGYGTANFQGMVLNGESSWLRVGVWGVPSGLLVLGAVLWSPAMQSLPGKLLVFLGDASYSIYLCTIPARSLVEHFWRHIAYWGGDLGIVFCAIICTLVGVVCYLLVERPLMRYFHNWYKPIPFHDREPSRQHG